MATLYTKSQQLVRVARGRMKKIDSKFATSHSHRYPTRFNLARRASSSSPLSMAFSVEDKAKDQVLVACKLRKVERKNLYLPREILCSILLRVPADILHDVAKYVCKQWYNIISDPLFVGNHHQLSSVGLIIQDPHELHQFYYIEGDSANLKETKIQLPFPAAIYGSFNGLVLLHERTYTENFHVINPVTKVKSSLPPLVGKGVRYGGTGFVVNSSGHCKVVHVSGKIRSFELIEVQMRVFTIGVDKAWRSIDLPLKPMNLVERKTLMVHPWFIAGLLYWFTTGFICFALDVDTETIYQFSGPMNLLDGRPVHFINMGTSLGLAKPWGCICRIWKLTDVKSSEWTELAKINTGMMIDRIDQLVYPSQCLCFLPRRIVDGDIWFFRRVDKEFVVVRYNLANGRFVFFRIKTIYYDTILYPHVHTLLSPMNC